MSEAIPLSALLNAAQFDENEPVLGFLAIYDGEKYRVRSIHGRTAELQSLRDGYKVTLRTETVLVDPTLIQWQPKPGSALQEPDQVSGFQPSLVVDKPEPKEQPVPAPRVVSPPPTGEGMMGIDSSPRTCRRCGQKKPASEFDRAGIYGGYCHHPCKPILQAERAAAQPIEKKPAPPPTSIVKIGVQQPPVIAKRAYKKRKKAAKAYSKTFANGHKNGRPALTFAELVGDLKNHLAAVTAERDQLRAEKAELFSQLQELLPKA